VTDRASPATIGPTSTTIGPTSTTIGPTSTTIGPTSTTIGPNPASPVGPSSAARSREPGRARSGCSGSEPDDAATDTLDPETLDELATRFAPTLFFDSAEPWFPTDPRPYTVEEDDETVVDGFVAFDGYHERYDEAGEPPNPTVFYNGVQYEDSPLAVVQFWLYSAFDQFTANFHWHDWEVLHVFVDLDTGDPNCTSPARTPAACRTTSSSIRTPTPSRVSSPSSARTPAPSRSTRTPASSSVGEEGAARGHHEHDDRHGRGPPGFPSRTGSPRRGDAAPVRRSRVRGANRSTITRTSRRSRSSRWSTARSRFDRSTHWDRPRPTFRSETGIAFRHADREDELADRTADEVIGYDLVQSAELEDITAFTGPQLSYEFAVPEIVEDAVASHITTTGIPWKQPRYENPALDVTAGNHRAEARRAVRRHRGRGVVRRRRNGRTRRGRRPRHAGGRNDDAPEGEGLTTTDAITESFVLIESDPEAVPTFGGGIAVANGIPEGDHRLTVNGAGQAPHSEELAVSADEPLTTAGVDGEIPLVARENATKVELSDAESDIDMTRTAVEDDFAGRIYDSAVDGSDAVYVHAGGAYTTEVRDADDEIGAYRIKPAPEAGIR